MNGIITSFLLLVTTTHQSSYALLPVQHLSKPTPLWNQAIQSSPSNGNVVQISPDNQWLYVTSSDGTLSKLDPAEGSFHDEYKPDIRRDDGTGGLIEEGNAQNQWVMYGTGGISFHMSEEEEEEDSFLVYWVFDVPPPSTGLRPSSRVIAVRHDDSKKLTVLWSKVIAGNIQGTPVIGSEGKFIYLTMNSIPAPPTPPPTTSPVAAPVITTNSPTIAPVTATPTIAPVVTTNSPVVTNTPTISPVVTTNMTSTNSIANSSIFNRSESTSNNTDLEETSTNPEYWWVEDTGGQPRLVCVKNSNYPEEYLNESLKIFMLFSSIGACCGSNPDVCNNPERKRVHHPNPNRRHLQQTGDKSGMFQILSHPLDGQVVYEFDSRSVLSIQQHNFAAANIAHRPQYGNYNGGKGNTNDVLIWGSLTSGGDGNRQPLGETVMFQLPKGFNASEEVVDTSDFQVRVLESVSWTTWTRPALSTDGLDVYFATTGNQFTGWNKGQGFDVVANLGPIPLPPESDVFTSVTTCPIVLADNDKLLLVTSTTRDTMFAIESDSGGILWTLDDMGISSPFTTPRISSDGSIAYFGKQNSVHSVDLTDGSRPWGTNGYQPPGSSSSERPPILADLSVSSTGEFLYYNGIGSMISAIRIAEVVPTQSPAASPSGMPSSIDSESPSMSVVPSTSVMPSLSTLPSVDPDYVPPSLSPTVSVLPSMSPSVSRSGSPSAASSNVPSSPPTERADGIATTDTYSPVTPSTASPVAEAVTEEVPSSSPSARRVFTPNANPPSSAAVEIPDDNSDNDENSSLSMTAIIGIAVGGGLVLILLIGSIWYVKKKKRSEDDGVDTDWAQSNAADDEKNSGGVEEGGTTFQYGGGEESKQQNELQW
mmetsp:Transcript_7453/g.13418  ORF Transcript_7453/g.13418 Transcript_7453/m.13418 type:complete len:876 (-) Transcript_7453:291-2918(-)|eukprot:CAMPEP_0201880002 /NCGR_PEP_ID=MMETSP0902-20130614/10734_1 /ASSEMBLY_ACC=CAM_ASM_000551 /TAXON_ID=420261 /ORGANISM="Thalassiosira antarctica, Strain CCMP982" /LENGTH=875 /DNA_ID=CAMNT_0048407963 /DNA_START=185 /DNA_END=2809 /DNA_ORIENTATION=-